jgi:hypothetical protein
VVSKLLVPTLELYGPKIGAKVTPSGSYGPITNLYGYEEDTIPNKVFDKMSMWKKYVKVLIKSFMGLKSPR